MQKSLLLLLSCVLFVTFSSYVRADCLYETPRENDENTTIFIGTVVQVNPLDRGYVENTFNVSRVWQGPLAHQLTVTTRPIMEDSFDFNEGKTYLVYASNSNGSLSIYCMPITPIEYANNTIKYLESIKPFTEITVPPSNRGLIKSSKTTYATAGIVLLLIGVGLFFAFRPAKRRS